MWQERAACRGEDPDVFFAGDNERGQDRRSRFVAAKAICARCPVIVQCRIAGRQERYGVWGGVDEFEREAQRR